MHGRLQVNLALQRGDAARMASRKENRAQTRAIILAYNAVFSFCSLKRSQATLMKIKGGCDGFH
jgi:hypothetical protein